MARIVSPGHVRLLGTRRLLTTSDLREEAIAELSGFGHASDFTQAFVHQYGVSPSDYRHGTKDKSLPGLTPSV